MNNNNKAIIYTRVSSTKQDNHGNSPKMQKDACIKFCEHNGIKATKVFHDALSGKMSKQRKGLQDAIKYSIDNHIEYFVIYDIGRFSREGYDIYSASKGKLLNAGVKLKDSMNIIGETGLAIQNDKFDMGEYKWNRENPSEMAEMVHSAQAKIEGNKILQRMISKEILLEQGGYSVRDSNLGFVNKKIKTNDGKKTIQVKDEFSGNILLEGFMQRSQGIKSDIEIVEEMNEKGLKTKQGNSITVKYFQSLVKNPVYAGVIISKWNSYRPIKTVYEGLVSIDTWNKANKGKRTIVELNNGNIEFIEGNNKNGKETIKQRRKKFDPNLPFRNLIQSSLMSGKMISGSFSNPKRSRPTGYYHPIRKSGMEGENIKKDDFEKQITSVFNEIQINDVIKIIFEDRFNKIFEDNKEKINKNLVMYQEQLEQIEREINEQEERICNIDSGLQRVLKTIEKRLVSLEARKTSTLEKIEQYKSSGYSNPENFKKFCFYIIEHLSELLMQSKSHEELSTLFKFVFKKTPTWDEINNRTFEIYPIFALQSKKELSKFESSSVNLKWQAH